MIKVKFHNKKLVIDNSVVSDEAKHTISDSVKFETVKFDFPKSWKDYTKTVVFKSSDEEKFNVVLDKNNALSINENECYIPCEVLKPPFFYLSVFGVLGDSIVTTTQVKVEVDESGYALGNKPSEPTPTEYQQLINIASTTKEIAESVRNDADNGLFKGDKGDKGDKGEQGIQGEKGEKGDSGAKGEQGIQGEKGDKGEQGIQGEKGDPGEVSKEYLHNNFAMAIRNTLSGSTVLANDVSSVEHKLTVKLSSDTITDFSSISLSRHGKNLLSVMGIWGTVINNAQPIYMKKGESYTFSMESDYTAWRLMFFGTDINGTPFEKDVNDGNNEYYYIQGMYTGTSGRLQHSGNITSGNVTKIVCNRDCIVNAIVLWNVDNETGKTYSNYQLELGSSATDYEPYIDSQTAIANTDGTVEGLTSVSPNMTVTTDTEGVIVDMTYNADTKMYIDNKIAKLL